MCQFLDIYFQYLQHDLILFYPSVFTAWCGLADAVHCECGINSGKSAVVVWKNLPKGGPKDTKIYPRVNLKPTKEAGLLRWISRGWSPREIPGTPCQQNFPCCTACLVWLILGAREDFLMPPPLLEKKSTFWFFWDPFLSLWKPRLCSCGHRSGGGRREDPHWKPS